jgi:hypothetical protein
MLREKWEFSYTADQLSEAASKNVAFHLERLNWWKEKRASVMATIRSEGLEINEKIALEYRSPKSQDWNNGSQVVIRTDLRTALQECHEKLSQHTLKLREYSGWQQMLTANPSATQQLDIEDWLFFFANPDSNPARTDPIL